MANRVVVILQDDELEDVRKRAGLVPLSAWFRSLAFPSEVETGDSGEMDEEGGADVTEQFKAGYWEGK